jgi:hypothetical protein
MKAEEAIKKMGYDPGELLEEDRNLRKYGGAGRLKGKTICICGHSMNYHVHIKDSNFHACSANKGNCKCSAPVEVAKVSNARAFNSSTVGYGRDHALTKGIVRLLEKDGTIEWLADLPKCVICGEKNGPIVPAPCDEDASRVIPNDQSRYNIMLCQTCLGERL